MSHSGALEDDSFAFDDEDDVDNNNNSNNNNGGGHGDVEIDAIDQATFGALLERYQADYDADADRVYASAHDAVDDGDVDEQSSEFRGFFSLPRGLF